MRHSAASPVRTCRASSSAVQSAVPIGQFALVFGIAGIHRLCANESQIPAEEFVSSCLAVSWPSASTWRRWTASSTRVGGDSCTDQFITRAYLVRTDHCACAELPDTEERSTVRHMSGVARLGSILVIAGLRHAAGRGGADRRVTPPSLRAATLGSAILRCPAIVIGMGSSLPELSVSASSHCCRKRGGLSVGNLVGSNVLDTLLVPGIAAAISPLAIPAAVLIVDLPVVLFVTTVLVLIFLYVTRSRHQRAPEAAVMLT